jgi:hypothetical protein
MKHLKRLAMIVAARLVAWMTNEPRLCYICYVAITDLAGVAHDYHLCSECYALTRPLAKRRRKERMKRMKQNKKSLAGAVPLSAPGGAGPQ